MHFLIEVTLSGIVISVSSWQPVNVLLSTEVSFWERVMFLRALQQAKAASPIEVTLSGIVMLSRAKAYAKAAFPIVVTLSGIVMLVI